MAKRISFALVVVLSLTMGVAACSSDDDMGGMDMDETSTTVSASADFNQADVTFAQGMIPHHEQAVEMADLAETRAERGEVKELAAAIKGAQDPEIEQMQGWLDEWDQPTPMGEDHAMGSGMMSKDDMTKLENATGAAFDQVFLTMMTMHHEGAVKMAEAEIQGGKNPEAKALAEQIVTTQQAEIQRMRGLAAG